MAAVTWSSKKAGSITASVEIVGAFTGSRVPDKVDADISRALGKGYKKILSDLKFTAEAEKTILVQGTKRPVIVVGLGDSKKLTMDILRRAIAAGVRAGGSYASAVIAVGETAASSLPASDVATGLYEGAALGSYGYGKYKKSNNIDLKKITISDVTKPATVTAFKRSNSVCEGVLWARDAINTPPNDKAPKVLAANIAKLMQGTSVKVTILDEAAIKRKKMTGVMAVGGGSEARPRFVRLTYKAPGAKKTIAFVGKGVVFDSGGLSIKPGDAMTTMKCDMSGGAAVAGAMRAIAAIKPKVNVEGYIPLVENMPSGSAYRVDDILLYSNGVSAEIQNTDAEGRLILADGLIEASSTKPDAIVDLATLTGACVVALGPSIAAAMGNSDKLRNKILDAGEKAGERFWPLPLPKDYRALIDTPVANVANAGPRWGGAITAGLFLQEFVDGCDWVHLDIAGPAFIKGNDGEMSEGGTGFGVRTLVVLAESFAS